MWAYFDNHNNLEMALSSLAKETDSWSDQARFLGVEMSDWLEIRKDHSRETIEDILIYYCLASVSESFIQSSLAIARSYNCVLHDIQSECIFAPDLEPFILRASASSAGRFLNIKISEWRNSVAV